MPDYLPTAIPTPRQLDFQDWEFGIFLHFGIRTFYEGYRDWDGQPMSAEAFNPTELDCEQWARLASEAGATYMVFVAKHHDGFANWPSAVATVRVAQSPWRDGRGDVVRAFTDACRKYGLKIGLYYSPAESSPLFDSEGSYDDHFITQITELLGNYGEVDMLWFDGCGSEDHEYDWPRIIGEIRRLQPNILIFNMGDPDYRWVGNEIGIAPSPCWNTVDEVPFSVKTERAERLSAGEGVWLPAECDCRIRHQNWFYEDADVNTVKSVDELIGLYYYSVGRGANLLLNIGPDRRGLLPEPDAESLLGFGDEIRQRFSQPIATFDDFEAESATAWSWVTPTVQLIDHVVIQEDLSTGEHIRRWTLEAESHGKTYRLHDGSSLGHKAIVRLPPTPIGSVRLRLRLLETTGPAKLRALDVFYTGGS